MGLDAIQFAPIQVLCTHIEWLISVLYADEICAPATCLYLDNCTRRNLSHQIQIQKLWKIQDILLSLKAS